MAKNGHFTVISMVVELSKAECLWLVSSHIYTTESEAEYDQWFLAGEN